MSPWLIFLTMFLTGMLLIGDYLIKYATISDHPIRLLIAAGVIWCLSIYGWYCINFQERLVILGLLFALFSMIGTTLIGMLGFGERLNVQEWIGLVLAIVATLLLSKKM